MNDARMLVKRSFLVLAIVLAVFGALSGSASAQKCYDVVGDEIFEVSCGPSGDLGPND